jgi:hypothetical protein
LTVSRTSFQLRNNSMGIPSPCDVRRVYQPARAA